ncbi:RNA-binding protein 44 [Grus japonensis]|uniref:RNA-binding protein 44 n=1 Tax=Grus japonensis TaxID=30415 RepID=A0ABC9X2C0_GRUJA
MELEKNTDVKSKRRCFNQTSRLFSYSEEAEDRLIRDVIAGANHSDFGQARSVNVSELKLSEESLPYLSSSLDADIETYNQNRMRICCAQVDESKKEADMLGRACDNTHVNCGVCDDCRQSHLGEDSQLEYLSAHEQDFDDRNSSGEFSEQRETIGIETLKLIDPVHAVPGAGVAKEQSIAGMSEDCSPAAGYGVGDQTCPEAAMPELPHLSPLLSNGMACDRQEEQTEHHSAVCGTILESHSCGNKEKVYPNLLVYDSLENREVKDIPLIDSTLPPQMAISEEVSENSARCIHSSSVKQENPLLSLRERAPTVAMQFCECTGDSDFYGCEESDVCACGASCTDCTAKDAETQFPISETPTNPFFGVEVADKSSGGNTSCKNSEHCENLKNVTSDSTVNQAVDASSDFRACFTTSRSTSAEVCLLSRAINTEITMMNKSRPVGWHRETCADVACNTDWSCGASSTEEIWSQLSGMLEEHAGGNTATAESSSQIQVVCDLAKLMVLKDCWAAAPTLEGRAAFQRDLDKQEERAEGSLKLNKDQNSFDLQLQTGQEQVECKPAVLPYGRVGEAHPGAALARSVDSSQFGAGEVTSRKVSPAVALVVKERDGQTGESPPEDHGGGEGSWWST